MIELDAPAQPPALTKDGILFARPGCQVRLRTRDDSLWTRRNDANRWKRIDAPQDAVSALRLCIEALLYEHHRMRDLLRRS